MHTACMLLHTVLAGVRAGSPVQLRAYGCTWPRTFLKNALQPYVKQPLHRTTHCSSAECSQKRATYCSTRRKANARTCICTHRSEQK